jgi:hypothetical protein
MSARPGPRRFPRPVEWRVIAVDEPNAEQHAQKLQQVLTDLTDEGFQIVSTMSRGSALVVTASRLCEPPKTEDAAPLSPANPKTSN